MGLAYKAVGWNRQKRNYDLIALSAAIFTLAAFIVGGSMVSPNVAPETLLIRGLAITAFGLLHVILAIGPLARLNPRFLPLLYNRRHLGVMMGVLASGHALISLIQFHGFGELHPIASVMVSDGSFSGWDDIPFQPFGLFAWVILLYMAVTSHDFWLARLSATTWKWLHMLVYVAYGLLVAHVAFGIGQHAASFLPLILTGAGVLTLVGLHVAAAMRSKPTPDAETEMAWVDAGPLENIPDQRAIPIQIAGETVAVFRDGNTAFALSGVCQHQGGPLAEGKLVNGHVVCPWHGYEYCRHSGQSPDPFEEWVPPFNVRVEDGHVLVASRPCPRGESATSSDGHDAAHPESFSSAP